MDLRPFGRTGLLLSPLSLGTMEFGSKVDEVEAARLFDAAIEAGINASTPPTSTRLAGARRSWGA